MRSVWALCSKPPMVGHQRIEGSLPGVAKRRMTQVVGQADSFGKAFVEAQRPGDGPTDLSDFDGVRQARTVVIIQPRREDLGLAFEPAKGRAVDDPIAVALEVRPVTVRGFIKRPAPTDLLRHGV